MERPGKRTSERHGFVDHAAGDAVAAVLADPGKVVPVLVRRGELQDLGGLLEDRVQRLCWGLVDPAPQRERCSVWRVPCQAWASFFVLVHRHVGST